MTPAESFYGLGIAPKLLQILDRIKFTIPTPIQSQAIPPAIEGKDLIGIAQTGTGKTLAFVVPMIQRLAQQKGQGLVLVPTRELALQVDAVCHQVGRSLGLRTAVLIGGASMGPQLAAIRRTPHIIVATPGRLLDHLEQKTVRLDTVRILILDEADRMLDMGFAPQINRILAVVPRQRQTMLFSATMPSQIVQIANRHMQLPIRVEIARSGTTADVDQEVFFVRREQKLPLLEKLLHQYRGTVLVFSRTKFGAKKITRVLRQDGQKAAEIHSNRSLSQRREALDGFKSGRYRVLVATDIAARGIDVTGIELVVNFDLPSVPEDYVHRIGRTGRAGQPGKAISLATPDQRRDVRDIERLIRTQLPVTPLPELPRGTSTERDAPARYGAAQREPYSRRFHPSRRREGFTGGRPSRRPGGRSSSSHGPRHERRGPARDDSGPDTDFLRRHSGTRFKPDFPHSLQRRRGQKRRA
ncbi:MAG: DEAD/DEAH box helicase [Candidatus Kerfeldbacteria bacterium]|nr:DEAD/DEAH box helicase [Candidatus Kerfeldbacteria bacterium]